jgi:hypothetical protein
MNVVGTTLGFFTIAGQPTPIPVLGTYNTWHEQSGNNHTYLTQIVSSVELAARIEALMTSPVPVIATPTPQLAGMAVSSGAFHLVLRGPPGSNYVILVSSDLTNWLPLGTYTSPAGGATNLSDPIQAGRASRFYRAVPQGQ